MHMLLYVMHILKCSYYTSPEDVTRLASILVESNQKACVVICTDGESTDGDLAEAMRPLQDLPVIVVVRLCTDASEVVAYWKGIDERLEVDIDVLDDIRGEAREVSEVNGWFTYGEPLHRMREFGSVLKEFDLIDESLLSSEHMRSICSYILGDPSNIENTYINYLIILRLLSYATGDGVARNFPCPDTNFEMFCQAVRRGTAQDGVGTVFDPISGNRQPWIDLRKVCSMYKYSNPSESYSCALM